MLSKRICRVSPLRVSLRRSFSELTTTYPFRKLQALPFSVSMEEAIRVMGPIAATICGDKMLASIAARYLPGLGFEANAIRPIRITPVYFPVWRLSAELRAEIKHEGTERMGTVQLDNTYIPGSDFKVISSVNVASFANSHDLVPFNEEMKMYGGSEVACIPFNISPFPLLDIVRNLSYTNARMSENISFTPSTVEPNLVAAYPILVPLWLAQYRFGGQEGEREIYHTCFVGAYQRSLPVVSEPIPTGIEWADALREALEGVGLDHFTKDTAIVMGQVQDFVNVRSVSLVPSEDVVDAIEEWLEEAIKSPGALKELVRSSPGIITDEDLRIRAATEQELSQVDNWLHLGEAASRIEKVLELISTFKMDPHAKILALGPGIKKGQSIDESIATLKANARDLEDQHQKTIPSWWKEWKQRSGAKLDNQS
ncbi:hypothetical protein BDQ17DRAFT_1355142 [Cyathus striatus]|nr:hypothetical protein BDQ17DRAFT_1355142 [Cyathus striatus]